MRGREVQRSRRRRAGFTVVEVMVSLGIMTVGAMGIIALQTHAIRSNGHARQLSIGMQIAQRWVERLKQDTHTWNVAGVPGTVLANTRYLNLINTAPNVFSTMPTFPDSTASPAFDYRGEELVLTPDDPRIFYCAAMRPAWVYFGRAMRVDVRVWWPREGFEMRTDFPQCAGDPAELSPGGAATTLYNQNAYHVVYLSTVLRLNPLR
jgi:type II secretory pathway pseudopilin PulG